MTTKTLTIMCFFLLFATMSVLGTDANRVRKYLADNGEPDAVKDVNFNLRNDQDEKGWYIDLWTYPNITKPTLAQCPSDEEAEAWAKEKWQTDKSMLLKLVENNYVTFLTNDWTMCLRNYSIITTNDTITVTNKTEVENILYLLQLKEINKTDYYNMAGEFDRYKTVITENGGIMAEVIYHNEIYIAKAGIQQIKTQQLKTILKKKSIWNRFWDWLKK